MDDDIEYLPLSISDGLGDAYDDCCNMDLQYIGNFGHTIDDHLNEAEFRRFSFCCDMGCPTEEVQSFGHGAKATRSSVQSYTWCQKLNRLTD